VAADAALAETRTVIARLDELAAADGTEVAALRAIFGDTFAVLPLVDVPAQWTDARAAAADPQFLGGDLAAPVAWLQQVARTRAPIERYLLAAAGDGGRLAAVQVPAAPRWIGLPGADIPPAATSVLVQAAGDEASGAAVAGLVIDEWTDVIPARSTTAGVTFNYNEPGARSPQAVLLAVPPMLLGEAWTLESLADIVTETADLARMRTVGPDEMPWLGRYLPALYVAEKTRGDTITADLRALAESELS